MYNTLKSSRKKRFYILGAIAIVLILCSVTFVAFLNHPIQLRSDSAEVEFIAEDGRIICVAVRGHFPYSQVHCPFESSYIQDQTGNVTEKVYTYTMQAKPTFFGQGMMSLKLDIETSSEMTHTYILKFADKDVKIVDGKVVE